MTTDHEAAADTKKTGMMTKIVEFVFWPHYAGLENKTMMRAVDALVKTVTRLNGELKFAKEESFNTGLALREELVTVCRRLESAENEMERLRAGNETPGAKFDGAKLENEKLKNQIIAEQSEDE